MSGSLLNNVQTFYTIWPDMQVVPLSLSLSLWCRYHSTKKSLLSALPGASLHVGQYLPFQKFIVIMTQGLGLGPF